MAVAALVFVAKESVPAVYSYIELRSVDVVPLNPPKTYALLLMTAVPEFSTGDGFVAFVDQEFPLILYLSVATVIEAPAITKQ